MNQLEDFLNDQLRPNKPWALTKEYPLAFNEKNFENIKIIQDQNNKILSHAVIKILNIKSPIGIFKVATIGSVVTAPEYRKKGLCKEIINECLRHAEKKCCDFAILWTDLFDFYQKFDFELCGSEISFQINTQRRGSLKKMILLLIFQKH